MRPAEGQPHRPFLGQHPVAAVAIDLQNAVEAFEVLGGTQDLAVGRVDLGDGGRVAARPDILDWRRESAEHPFGTIKQWMNQGAFLMRGLANVRGEFSLTTLVYNTRRAITLVGVPGLIAAARA